MSYGRTPQYIDPYKRMFGINGSAAQTPLDVARRRVGAIDCALIETPLRNQISAIQTQLGTLRENYGASCQANDVLHKIVGAKREQVNKVLSENAELRDRLSVAEANLLCEQGAYRKIVGLRKEDIEGFNKYRKEAIAEREKLDAVVAEMKAHAVFNRNRANTFEEKIASLEEVVKIERAHAVVLQKQFDIAIQQRDDHKAALAIQQSIAKAVIASQQQTVAKLREEVRNLRMKNVYFGNVYCASPSQSQPSVAAREGVTTNQTTPMKIDVDAIKDMFEKSGWKSATPIIVPAPVANLPQKHCQMQEKVSVRKYPGVITATYEALNAQFKHGASVEEAQAYLDFCEAHSLTGPYHGFQQWKAIYRAAGR